MTIPVRDRPDACPGALRTHRAADGLLVRLRLPGGRLPADSARGLAEVAERHADGAVHLTSRGNLQLRGVPEVDGGADPVLVAAVQACGLLPSPTHELVRNVVASPWSGRRAGLVDVEPVVAAVDAKLCADPALAALPGRFLVALDDGTGDVAGLEADVTWWAQNAQVGALLVGGHDTGLRVAADQVATAVVEIAHAFLRARSSSEGTAWHVAELPGGAGPFAATLESTLAGIGTTVAGPGATANPLQTPAPTPGLPALGTLEQKDARFGVAALVPLGRLDAGALRHLADAAELASGQVVVTPWREVVVSDVGAAAVADVQRLLSAAGLVTDDDSPWRRVSACVGRPSCARALADVRSMAAQTVAAMHDLSDAPRVHFAGCERRCGRPASAHREVVAEAAGWSVADVGKATAQGERAGWLVTKAADVQPASILSEDP